MKRMSLAMSIGLVAAFVGLSAQIAPVVKADRALKDKTVTVTGCVAEGIEAGSYTLTSATIIANLASSPAATGTTGTAGTEQRRSPAHTSAWYQLQGDGLRELVGHKVTATGTTGDDKRLGDTAIVQTTESMKDRPPTLTVVSVKTLSTTCP